MHLCRFLHVQILTCLCVCVCVCNNHPWCKLPTLIVHLKWVRNKPFQFPGLSVFTSDLWHLQWHHCTNAALTSEQIQQGRAQSCDWLRVMRIVCPLSFPMPTGNTFLFIFFFRERLTFNQINQTCDWSRPLGTHTHRHRHTRAHTHTGMCWCLLETSVKKRVDWFNRHRLFLFSGLQREVRVPELQFIQQKYTLNDF